MFDRHPGKLRERLWQAAAAVVWLSIGAAGAQTPPASALPHAGEILLEGRVQATTATRRIMLFVDKVTLPSGASANLAPAHFKQVVVHDDTVMHLVTTSGEPVPFDRLSFGTRIDAVGKDFGVGSDLPAREVDAWVEGGLPSQITELPAHPAAGTPAAETVEPNAGEILLTGAVQAVTAGGRVVMLVSAVTLPGGSTAELLPPRIKQLIIKPDTPVHIRGRNSITVLPAGLKPGDGIEAVGWDDGIGTDLRAREVAVWNGVAATGEYTFQNVPAPR